MYHQNHPDNSVLVERVEFARRLRDAEQERVARRLRRRRNARHRT